MSTAPDYRPNISVDPAILRTADRDAAARMIRDAEIAKANSTILPGTPGTPVQVRNYSPTLSAICENLYYRQSMLKDYQLCPMMMLYKWIAGHEETDTFFAAVLGTAGHRVIQEMHEQRNFDWTIVGLHTRFMECVTAAINDSRVPPKLSANFTTLHAQAMAAAPEYIDMLFGYQRHEDNQHFHPTLIEQPFVIEVEDEFSRKFLFTGVIDQAGFFDDGAFVLRDLKFRANAFKSACTGSVARKLDLQLCIYSYGVKFGNPTCEECRPRYVVSEDDFSALSSVSSGNLGDDPRAGTTAAAGTLLYTGPCEACKQKIGTAAWPRLIPVRTELIWMRDYVPRRKDEHPQYIDDPAGIKERNPSTGRMRKRKVPNPDWAGGYKKGDYSGSALYRSERAQTFLEVRMADAVRMAGMIRDGRFYRKEGDHCNYWCKFKEPCLGMLETEIEEKDAGLLAENIATYDPFGG